MSKSFKTGRSPGKEWWGKRPMAGFPISEKYNQWWKRRLHKLERKEAEKAIRREMWE